MRNTSPKAPLAPQTPEQRAAAADRLLTAYEAQRGLWRDAGDLEAALDEALDGRPIEVED